MYRIDKKSFIDDESNLSRYIITELISNKTQLEKQENSIDQYQETHEKNNHPPIVLYLMNDFQAFIALNIFNKDNSQALILDVGCGISRHFPTYFNRLKNSSLTYVGLDPFEENQKNREYLFINGKFEGLHKYINTKFDYLIFSTSLDHFENLNDVKDEIKQIIKPNGIVFFWVGLHDVDIVSKDSIASWYKKLEILNTISLIKYMLKTPLFLAKLYMGMIKRNNDLKNNIPLDKFHFHYFLKKDIYICNLLEK